MPITMTQRTPIFTPHVWHSAGVPGVAAPRGFEDDSRHGSHPGGTPAGEGRHEIFASGPSAEALQVQFERHPSAFAAVHAVADGSPQQIVTEVIAASKRPRQTLAIRRQGIGATLATIDFADLPAPGGASERAYNTHADCDEMAGRQIAGTLLAFSRLGVVLVGASVDQGLAERLAPLRERLLAMPWPNRQLLLIPMAGGLHDLAEQARQLVRGTSVAAVTTAVAAHPAAVWSHIRTAWSVVSGHRLPPDDTFLASPAPWPTSPMPPTAIHDETPSSAAELQRLQRFVQACAALRGAADVCLFRIVDRRPLAHAGRSPDVQALAAQGATLLAGSLRAAAALGSRSAAVETQVTLDGTILLARVMPGHQGVGLIASFDRALANPATLGAHLQRLEALLAAH